MIISSSMSLTDLRSRIGFGGTTDQARQLRALLTATDHVSTEDIPEDELAELCERACSTAPVAA